MEIGTGLRWSSGKDTGYISLRKTLEGKIGLGNLDGKLKNSDSLLLYFQGRKRKHN